MAHRPQHGEIEPLAPVATSEGTTRPLVTTKPIIKSSVTSDPDIGTGFGFKSWTYLKAWITTNPEKMDSEADICVDIGCSKTLGDAKWMKKKYPNVPVRPRAMGLPVKGIGKIIQVSTEYMVVPFYFQGKTDDGKEVVAHFTREVGLVDGLDAHMLVGMDVIGAEKFDIMMSTGPPHIRI